MKRNHTPRESRSITPMTATIRHALGDRNLLDAFRARPAFHRNNYLGWIARAEREETRQQRLQQMIAELEQGDQFRRTRYRSA